jgi:HK97 family phage portal protein
MSILARRSPVNIEERVWGGPWGPWVDGRTVPSPIQDVRLNPSSVQALRSKAVVACVGMRAGTLAQLPLYNCRLDERGNTLRLPNQPQLFTAPSAVVPASVWKVQMSISRDIFGYAFGKITAWDAAMYPARVEWIDPSRIKPRLLDETNIEWRVNGEVVDPSLYLHIPSRWVLPGNPIGISPLAYSGLVDLDQAAQQFGSDWFRNGSVPSGILYSDKELDADQSKELVDRIIARWRQRRPAVLGSGLRYEKISVAPNESQFLETARQATADIAHSFGIPASMVGAAIAGSAITYQTLMDNRRQYLGDSIQPDLSVITQSLDRNTPRGQFSEFDTDAFAPVDPKARYEAFEIAVRAGFMTPNEVRAKEGLPPLPDAAVASFEAAHPKL